MIAFVVTLASVLPVISTVQIFSQEVDFQTQWPDIVISHHNQLWRYCFIISFDTHSNEVT